LSSGSTLDSLADYLVNAIPAKQEHRVCYRLIFILTSVVNLPIYSADVYKERHAALTLTFYLLSLCVRICSGKGFGKK
jgi:NAD(P)H-dependent FMN reductase